MRTVYPLAFVVALSLLLSACPSVSPDKENGSESPKDAATHTDNNPAIQSPIKARQDLMYRWGKAHRHLQTMVKDPAQFDFNELHAYITLIDTSQEQMWAYFDDDALSIPNSKVNRLIKDNPNDYQAHIESFTTAFNTLKNTAHHTQRFDNLKPLMDKVNQECRACHKRYKKRG